MATITQVQSGLPHEVRGNGPHETPGPPRLRVPFVLITLTCAAWAATLNNAVFIDESLYIRAGRAYLSHWLSGRPLPADLGTGFSGLPVLYPVLAGSLDLIGGLALVRAFSLVCLVATMIIVRDLTMRIFNRRAGLVGGALFGLTGPVLYVGHLGTFDALVIVLLALALLLGVAYDSWWSSVGIAVLLTVAVLTKYTAYVFVPPILVLTLFSPHVLARSSTFSTWVRRSRPPRGRVLRNGLATLLVGCLTLVVYLTADEGTRTAMAVTTTERSAFSPAPASSLMTLVPEFAWPIFAAAILGLVWLAYAERWTALLFGLGLFGTALLLPLGQLALGEAVSFEKHLAYSALFLAPLAGWGMARPWRLAIWTPVLVWFLVLTGVWGFFRSHDLIQYPDVRPVAEALQMSRGIYLSSASSSLAYYTLEEPGVQWEATFDVYAQGPARIRQVIAEERYEAVILQADSTGSSIQDDGQKVLLQALENNDYVVTELGEQEEWLVYSPRR